jgi:hypothetical protein
MWPVVWMLPLLAAAGTLLAVWAFRRSDRWPRTAGFAQAALLGVSTLGLTVYVASEDDYRRGGISRWEAYDAEALTIAAIGIGLLAAIVLVGASAHRRPGLAVAGFIASAVALALQFVAFLANSLN